MRCRNDSNLLNLSTGLSGPNHSDARIEKGGLWTWAAERMRGIAHSARRCPRSDPHRFTASASRSSQPLPFHRTEFRSVMPVPSCTKARGPPPLVCSARARSGGADRSQVARLQRRRQLGVNCSSCVFECPAMCQTHPMLGLPPLWQREVHHTQRRNLLCARMLHPAAQCSQMADKDAIPFNRL